jgi:uncharacterized protein YjbI with pentapeptide repeats/beta-lactamase regulating signal transducer with metallopeptidase domain
MLAALIDTVAGAAAPISAIVVNALWEGALLTFAVWALVRSWPRLNASTRYAIWSATLAAVVVVPIATTLPFLTFATDKPATSAPLTAATAKGMARAPSVTRALTTPIGRHSAFGLPAPVLPPRFKIALSVPVAIGIFVLWGVLAIAAIVRLAFGLYRLERLKRDALPLPVEYRDAMERWMQANKGSREVRLCVSDETDVPVAVGLFDSMILIPRSLLERLSAPEVDQISLHELAHLRRADDWTNGFQRVALALLAWNPAALFIAQQLDLEREVACDDYVLSLTGTVRPYALCLTKMAETSTWPRQPIPAPGVFATRKHISLRIERLLGGGRNVATKLSFGPAAIALIVVTTLSLAIAAVAPSVAASRLPALTAVEAPQQPAVAGKPAPAPKIERIVVYRDIPSHVSIAAVHVDVPAVHVNVPAVHVPAMNVRVPPANVHVPAMNVAISQLRAIPTMLAQAGLMYCNKCDFEGVNWAGKDLRGRSYNGVDLSKADLENTDFSSGRFSGVDFSKANLRGARFRDARLTGCDFSGANLTGTDFTGAMLSGCRFTGASMTSSEIRAVLDTCTGCDFSKSDLAGADLSNVKISGIDLSGADLAGANLSGSRFTGVDFSRAKLDGARLEGATFSGCDLSGVDLSHVDLSKTNMIGTDFSARGAPKP